MKKTYRILFILLFLIEIGITYTEGFIRYTFGDFLVVILMYCGIKSFVNISNKTTAILVLAIAYFIEFIQLTTISQLEIFNKFPVLKLIIGTTFQWTDLVAYTLGILFTLYLEKRFHHD
jgi:hypothetical protein